MNSRIYQIGTYPFKDEEFLSEADLYESRFIGSIAECVYDELDRAQELEAFQDLLRNSLLAVCDGAENTFTISREGKEHYLRLKYVSFKKALDELALIDAEDFIDKQESISDQLSDLRRSFCDVFGDYVSSDEFDMIPFDEFVRIAECGTKYYIGGVLGYKW